MGVRWHDLWGYPDNYEVGHNEILNLWDELYESLRNVVKQKLEINTLVKNHIWPRGKRFLHNPEGQTPDRQESLQCGFHRQDATLNH